MRKSKIRNPFALSEVNF